MSNDDPLKSDPPTTGQATPDLSESKDLQHSTRPDVSFLPRTPSAVEQADRSDDESEPTPTSPLARCPYCAYDLRFCRSPYCCPECGFTYDELSRAWWDADTRPGYGQHWLVILIVGGLAAAMIVRFVQQTARLLHLVGLGLAVVTAACVGYEVLRLRRTHRLGRCIVACPRGLFVRSDRYEDWIPWSAFDDLVFSRMGFYIRQRDSDQTVEIPMSFDAFEDEDDWVAFRDELHQFRVYYSNR